MIIIHQQQFVDKKFSDQKIFQIKKFRHKLFNEWKICRRMRNSHLLMNISCYNARSVKTELCNREIAVEFGVSETRTKIVLLDSYL